MPPREQQVVGSEKIEKAGTDVDSDSNVMDVNDVSMTEILSTPQKRHMSPSNEAKAARCKSTSKEVSPTLPAPADILGAIVASTVHEAT